MIDLRLLREDPEKLRNSQLARGDDPALVEVALAASERRNAELAKFESLRAEQKALGKQVAKAKGDEKTELLNRTKALAEAVKAAEKAAGEAAADLEEVQYQISNVIEGAPPGGADDYLVVKEVGTPRDFAAEGFEPADHVALGEGIGAFDTIRGAKVSGARFYFLTGVGALLELALLNAAMDQAVQDGFIPMITPTLVKPETMRGTGFLGAHSDEIYRLEKDDLYLVGTSEVALAGFHADEILDLSDGPLRYAGWSSCYRREAGAAGRDTRGIIRVHQFNKVEMFVYCHPEDAEAEHQRLLGFEEKMLAKVDLPYRVIDTAAGDLGSSAARKFDCEAWLPSQNRFLELTSTSNCTTFQARRLGVRERTDKGTQTVATLNGTLATTRWIVAILENHQNADGSVTVPEGLRPYLGGRERFEPVAGRKRPVVEPVETTKSDGPEQHSWLVASDIDGTLAHYDQSLSPAVRDAVREVIAAGHHVVLASGRSVGAMRDIARELGLVKGWMVCSNGSVTVRLDPELPDGMQITDVIKFDPEPTLRLLAEHLPGARFAVEDVGVGFHVNELFPDGELWGDAHVVAMDHLWDQEVTRIIVRGGDEATDEFREVVSHLGLNDVSYAVGYTNWLDIAPKGVTKASAVEAAREKLGIPADRTFAIGDGFNDVEMLQWAARSFAMGNADPDVKAVADQVTDSVDEDGAAKALRTLLH